VDGYWLQIRHIPISGAESDWKTIEFPPRLKHLCMDFHHLQPGARYEVRVAAQNSVGIGKYSPSGGPFRCDDPVQILNIDARAMLISLEQLMVNKECLPEGFEIQMRDAKTISDFETILVLPLVEEQWITNLKPCSYYQFRARPKINGAWYPWHKASLSRIAQTSPSEPEIPNPPRQ